MQWRFDRVPMEFWKNTKTRREFFDWLGNQLGYKSMDDWYNVTVENIHEHVGSWLLNYYYNGSPSKALQSAYPEHNWMLWRFGRVPIGFWEKPENQREFFD